MSAEVVVSSEEYEALRDLETTVRYIDNVVDTTADFGATDWDELMLAYTRKRMLLDRLYEFGDRA